MMGITRSVLRPALADLVAAGYLEIRRGRAGGAYVRCGWRDESPARVRRSLLPRWEQLQGLLDLRSILEVTIARNAAQRRTEEDVAVIAVYVEAYAVAGEDRIIAAAADRSLHAAIGDAAANEHLGALSIRLHKLITRGLSVEPYSPELRPLAMHQHEALLESIRQGDPDEAERWTIEHFLLSENAVRALLERVAPEVVARRPAAVISDR
jgi:GntR family transcriptional repressor for pyruvate dehydrogenase complex